MGQPLGGVPTPLSLRDVRCFGVRQQCGVVSGLKASLWSQTDNGFEFHQGHQCLGDPGQAMSPLWALPAVK